LSKGFLNVVEAKRSEFGITKGVQLAPNGVTRFLTTIPNEFSNILRASFQLPLRIESEIRDEGTRHANESEVTVSFV
jgi:hypothetical protein